MPDFNNDNRGALFKNDRKEKDTQPDYRGDLNVMGVDYWLSAWLKEDKNGNKYMSLSVQPKEEKGKWEEARERLKKDPVIEDISNEPINMDDIPF